MITNKIYNLLLKGWFRTKGRSSRQEYILRFSMMWMLGFSSNYMYEIYYLYDNIFIGLFSVLFGIIFILSVIQVFFVTHRRLHDLNASGWWQLVTFIPFGQILMIGFIFFKGTDGSNKYGLPPNY